MGDGEISFPRKNNRQIYAGEKETDVKWGKVGKYYWENVTLVIIADGGGRYVFGDRGDEIQRVCGDERDEDAVEPEVVPCPDDVDETEGVGQHTGGGHEDARPAKNNKHRRKVNHPSTESRRP